MRNINIRQVILVSTVIGVLFYILGHSLSGMIFLIPLSIFLANKTNKSIRHLKNWFAWLVFLVAEFFLLFLCLSFLGSSNQFLSFITNLFILYFLSQLGEIIWNWLKEIPKKEKITSTVFTRLVLIIFEIAIITIVVLIHGQIKNKLTDDKVPVTSSVPLETKVNYQDEISNPTKNISINLILNSDKPQLQNVSEKEAVEIEKTMAIFEQYKYEKDFVGAINMMTPPENKEEQSWLDHLLGTDLKKINVQYSSRFLDKVNFHFLVGYNIEKIEKKNNTFYISVKELRVLNTAEEGVSLKYETSMQNITFEISNNYEISKYYHSKSTTIANLKYEGFAAF